MGYKTFTAWAVALGLFVVLAGGESVNTAPYVITVDDVDAGNADTAAPVVCITRQHTC